MGLIRDCHAWLAAFPYVHDSGEPGIPAYTRSGNYKNKGSMKYENTKFLPLKDLMFEHVPKQVYRSKEEQHFKPGGIIYVCPGCFSTEIILYEGCTCNADT